MKIPSETRALRQVAERLAELLDVERQEVRCVADSDKAAPDAVLQAGPASFLVEWKSSGAAAQVVFGIEKLRAGARYAHGKPIPLLVVPFMGETGRRRCAEAGIAWLDLSGNARVIAPGLHIHVEGKPNRYKRQGRPGTAFAPKSARIVRWLLMHPDKAFSQRTIAHETGIDEGHASRIVAKLEQDQLILRDKDGAIRVRDEDVLLDAWTEDYDFTKHHRLAGHVPMRTSEALLRQLARRLDDEKLAYAATGLAAAWLLDGFASFRIVTLYLAEEPVPDLLEALSFRAEDRGANVWLVVPNDAGVFHRAARHEEITCVHPVQAYLDLLAHPERAMDAAQSLRAARLKWSSRE